MGSRPTRLPVLAIYHAAKRRVATPVRPDGRHTKARTGVTLESGVAAEEFHYSAHIISVQLTCVLHELGTSTPFSENRNTFVVLLVCSNEAHAGRPENSFRLPVGWRSLEQREAKASALRLTAAHATQKEQSESTSFSVFNTTIIFTPKLFTLDS